MPAHLPSARAADPARPPNMPGRSVPARVAWLGAWLGAAASPAGAALVPPATLPQLAGPPFVEAVFLDSPWPLIAAVVIPSLIAAVVLFQRGKRLAGAIVASDIMVIPAVLFLISDSIVTAREELRARSIALVDAVAAADGAALAELLSDRARLEFFQAPEGWDKGRIVTWVEGALGGEYAVRAHEVREVQAETGPEATLGRTRVGVRVTPSATERPQLFICMLTWRQEVVGTQPAWRVIEIEPLWLQGFGELTR